ncbi:TIGR02300 family protein [Paracoccus sp. SCSIO 75233]|uniref:TIGR02300 family protein n=1 Tax=Paracoccus sp. SCSIO 75233 TaxID=3017782 RepID=UPI0022F00B2C|nr:TIGR02300 family protein [Paracoccus sp. SCSIO 75233]WBU54627.1 TIGR02300 family protein [Paracoccus sp. SCSIO 75233]
MPKEEWGTKRLCPHCGSRFYDLQNDPMTCPVCNTEFTLESLTSGRGRSLTSEKTASKDDDDQSDDLIDDDLDDDDDSGSVDDDLLEDDDDDDDVSLDDIADVSGDDED